MKKLLRSWLGIDHIESQVPNMRQVSADVMSLQTDLANLKLLMKDYDIHHSDEPGVILKSSGLVDKTGEIKLEIDFNDAFVEEMRRRGFHGETDADVVNNWVENLARRIAIKRSTLNQYEGFDESLRQGWQSDETEE